MSVLDYGKTSCHEKIHPHTEPPLSDNYSAQIWKYQGEACDT